MGSAEHLELASQLVDQRVQLRRIIQFDLKQISSEYVQ